MKLITKWLVGIVAGLITLWLFYVFSPYLTLEYIKQQQSVWSEYLSTHWIQAALTYFALYVLIAAFSIPGAAVATLIGAALFGFWASLILVSFASSIGATLAFLASRFLFRDWVQKRFGEKLNTINRGIEKEGSFYLFTLRLIPVFPFFLINLLMGLTPIRTGAFYLISQIGMLPGTAVYLNAGTQLAGIDTLSGIISLPVLLSFALLGLFPLIVKKLFR